MGKAKEDCVSLGKVRQGMYAKLGQVRRVRMVIKLFTVSEVCMTSKESKVNNAEEC